MPEHRRSFWKRHFRAILWAIAIAGLVISIVTGFKFVFLFLPLFFSPMLFGRSDNRRDPNR